MSTSFLYHTLGLRDYQYLKTEYKKSKIFFHIKKYVHRLRCSNCGSSKFILRGHKTRQFKSVPMGNKRIILVVKIQRLECLECHCLKQDKLHFAEPKKTYTRAFARFVLELLKYMTINDVALHLGVCWDTVKDIQKKYLEKHFARPKLDQLQHIAIDEISVGRKHRYLTLVLDLASGAVVFIGNGKGADSLKPFWNTLKSSGAQIKAVAIDMSAAYIQAVRENLPEATIVFDHFHIIKLYNDKLTELRRQLFNQTSSFRKAEILKGTRWLLLKNPENLDESKNEKTRLERALQINQPLATAYYLKEDLRQLWSQNSKEQASQFLEQWIKDARQSGITILKKMSNTISAYRSGILAWYDYPISTGPLEGTNNKIKTMQRQSYGFRDKEFFKLKIFAIHQAKYALIG